ncbi:hypothetical protein CBOM_02186 [Ceraceosorus bombacis]|uniref:Uncharacterized protein n=1 Tax=Ceraceosorus bombacis TaxID=401625 RepID=A0A0P1BEM2_9BASI|nr:hypothetical protein CBOM_02186 [Ceraceosorus bombacis]
MSSTLTSIAHWPSTSAAPGSDASHWHASTSRSAIQHPNHRSPLGSAPHSPILDAMPDGAGRRDVPSRQLGTEVDNLRVAGRLGLLVQACGHRT